MEACRARILVVEDEPELRFILAAHLRAAGYGVIEAADGNEALAVAAEEQPDVVIMDIGLPKLDGIAATRALRANERTADLPVIMLTARTSPQDVCRGLEAGAQEYLAKPFDMTELLARVQTVHRLAQARQELDRLNAALEDEVSVKTRRLQILYDFMRALHQTQDRERVLDLVIDSAGKITGAKRISLLIADGEGKYLVCERAVGIEPAVVEKIHVHSIEGIAGQVFTTGKTLSAKALGESNPGKRIYGGEAFLSTPLVSALASSGRNMIGVLNMTEKPGDVAFTGEEIECVRSIADAAGIALDNVQRRERLRESVTVLLRTVGHLAEYRDEETTRHIERVSIMSRVLATELVRSGVDLGRNPDDFVEMLIQAAPMHDIGKVGIPDHILTKPGKLTEEEFRVMQTHTEIGRGVLSEAVDPTNPVPQLTMCIDIAYCHHERYDGTGYPRGIKGSEIPIAARIIALVDAYDAITSERRYSSAKPHEAAVETIRREAGRHFDPVIVEAFLRCHEQFRKVRDRFTDAAALAGATSP